VGSDQINEPWLDEALSQYLTLLYHERYSSPLFVEGYLAFWRSRWGSADGLAVGLPVDAYSSENYSGIVYGRGLFFFEELAKDLGKEPLEQALAAYFQRHAWEFVTSSDLLKSLESSCPCELDELFESWIYQ
jgi:aminopeptidase N